MNSCVSVISFVNDFFIIVFTIQEIKKLKEFKFAYFKSIWNWLELLLLVVSIFSQIWLIEITSELTNEGAVKKKKKVEFSIHLGFILKAVSINHKMNCQSRY